MKPHWTSMVLLIAAAAFAFYEAVAVIQGVERARTEVQELSSALRARDDLVQQWAAEQERIADQQLHWLEQFEMIRRGDGGTQ
jgi:hypothetical protein